MSNAHHYYSNHRDTIFNLFEVLDIRRTSLGRGPFSHFDEETARETLRGYERLAHEQFAPSFFDSDRIELTLDADGNVTIPPSLKSAMTAYYDADCHRLALPEHVGGMGAPPSVSWAAFEFTAGSAPALAFYLFGPFAARTVDRLCTEDQKSRYLQNFIERRWGGSMVLTEPDAGSDVGAGRTSAKQIKDDLWEITGTKRFITNGDFDGAENIVHMVLARPEGGPAGTKGLSLFMVPKFWVHPDGTLGERNGVYVTKLEKKMGIKGSATCELTFGDRGPARGLLVGNRHDGIRQMFHIIEQARMAVGVKSMATLSTAYLNALNYAKERVQGPDLLRAMDKNSPRVRIVAHPDVRRMLMSQKAHAEGMRALCLYTAWVQDQVDILGGHGDAEAQMMDARNDLLLPLVKGYCSEKAYEQLALSLQTYGGSGYIQDYPIEQYVRDQKIDSLYEGTTHIQALDLFFRKIAKDGGATLQSLLGELEEMLQTNAGGDALATERGLLSAALEDFRAIMMTMMGKANESLYHVGLQGNRILMALAELVIGWLMLRQGVVALAARAASSAEKPFYEGKLATVRWYCRNVLPGIGLTRRLVDESTLELMDLPEESF